MIPERNKPCSLCLAEFDPAQAKELHIVFPIPQSSLALQAFSSDVIKRFGNRRRGAHFLVAGFETDTGRGRFFVKLVVLGDENGMEMKQAFVAGLLGDPLPDDE